MIDIKTLNGEAQLRYNAGWQGDAGRIEMYVEHTEGALHLSATQARALAASLIRLADYVHELDKAKERVEHVMRILTDAGINESEQYLKSDILKEYADKHGMPVEDFKLTDVNPEDVQGTLMPTPESWDKVDGGALSAEEWERANKIGIKLGVQQEPKIDHFGVEKTWDFTVNRQKTNEEIDQEINERLRKQGIDPGSWKIEDK